MVLSSTASAGCSIVKDTHAQHCGCSSELPALRRAVEERGRDPDQLHVVPIGISPDRGKLEYYQSLGVSEAVLRLPPAPRDAVMPVLDQYAQYL